VAVWCAEGQGHSTGQRVELRVLKTSGSVVAVDHGSSLVLCDREGPPLPSDGPAVSRAGSRTG